MDACSSLSESGFRRLFNMKSVNLANVLCSKFVIDVSLSDYLCALCNVV